jgi:hypothetical protein
MAREDLEDGRVLQSTNARAGPEKAGIHAALVISPFEDLGKMLRIHVMETVIVKVVASGSRLPGHYACE